MGTIIWPWTIAGTSGANDPYFANTVLLLSGDGANGSTTFTDESFAAHGNADVSGLNNDVQVQTSVKKFGTGSIRYDGTNDRLKWSDHNDWSFGSGAFTVEGWFYFDASNLATNNSLVAHWEATGNQREWTLSYRGDLATDVLQFSASSAGSAADLTVSSSAWTPTANTWYHIAVDRSGNVFRIYVDGTMLGTATNSITLFNSTPQLRLGTQDDVNFFKGNMDEIRITKGVARYASDSGYTVPTTAFPRA